MLLKKDELMELVPELMDFYFEANLAFIDGRQTKTGAIGVPAMPLTKYERGRFGCHIFSTMGRSASDFFKLHSATQTVITVDDNPVWVAHHRTATENEKSADVFPYRRMVLRDTFVAREFYGGVGPEREVENGKLLGLSYSNDCLGDFGKFRGLETIYSTAGRMLFRCEYSGELWT